MIHDNRLGVTGCSAARRKKASRHEDQGEKKSAYFLVGSQ